MDIIADAAAALAEISEEGISVAQGWYNESLHETHVTLWKQRGYEAGHADDDCDVEAGEIQVNIWSTQDQQALKARVKRLMKAGGFMFTEDNDQAEPDTGVFTNAMRFLKVQENDETEE